MIGDCVTRVGQRLKESGGLNQSAAHSSIVNVLLIFDNKSNTSVCQMGFLHNKSTFLGKH